MYSLVQWRTQSHIILLENECVFVNFIYKKISLLKKKIIEKHLITKNLKQNKICSYREFKLVLDYSINPYNSNNDEGSISYLITSIDCCAN